MKKALTAAASIFLVVIAANAQSEKEKPPPPPPPPRIVKDGKMIKKPPVITVNGKMADEFYTRNPSVADISRQGHIITLKKKDRTIEKYDMSKKEEHKDFSEKYGVSPIPPPPPPPKVVKEKKLS